MHPREAAVLIAATPAMLKKYQPFINLWRCYALRHGHAFLLETDEGLDGVEPYRTAVRNMLNFCYMLSLSC